MNWPKRRENETPKEYADRVGVNYEDLKIVKNDPVTGEMFFLGYGWYKSHEIEP